MRRRRSRTRCRRCPRRSLRRRRSRRHLGPVLLLASIACRGFALFRVFATHLGADVVDALRGALLALRLIEHFLLLTQAFKRLTPIAPGLIQARCDDEALAAFLFARDEGGLCLIALGLDAIAFGTFG